MTFKRDIGEDGSAGPEPGGWSGGMRCKVSAGVTGEKGKPHG